jgi:FkbH-like protein
MILKEQHFAAMRINWDDKVSNIKDIAKELNIGLDSMVFLDDSAINREAMRSFLPKVETPELPIDPKEYTTFLLGLPYFVTNAVTDEDKMRGSMYVTERLRLETEKSFANRADFLKSLDIKVKIFNDPGIALSRLAQMTEKTNQFNTNKMPMNEDEVREFAEDAQKEVFYASASDRFGDHGIIALAFISKDMSNWQIDPMLMSCRVIGRGIEDAFLWGIAKEAKKQGAETISANFVQSEKNLPARTFIERCFGEKRKTEVINITKPDWITII